MSTELDTRYRAALFAHIRALRDQAGGLIPSAQLNEGMLFDGQRVPIWNQQMGIYRPGFLRDPGAAVTIQTSFKDPYDDERHPDRDRLVYKYQGEDPTTWTNVALRRAFELRAPLLYLVAGQPGGYRPVFPCYISENRPADLAIELLADVETRNIDLHAIDPMFNVPQKEYATAAVKRRLHQDRFRFAVLSAYRRQCAMCLLKHVPLLDAAHILPDRDERSLPEVPNGLALCRIHHGAYDVGIIGVAPDYQIHVRPDVLAEHDGPMLRYGLQAMQGGSIELPRRSELKPNREYLAERYEQFRAA